MARTPITQRAARALQKEVARLTAALATEASKVRAAYHDMERTTERAKYAEALLNRIAVRLGTGTVITTWENVPPDVAEAVRVANALKHTCTLTVESAPHYSDSPGVPPEFRDEIKVRAHPVVT